MQPWFLNSNDEQNDITANTVSIIFASYPSRYILLIIINLASDKL